MGGWVSACVRACLGGWLGGWKGVCVCVCLGGWEGWVWLCKRSVYIFLIRGDLYRPEKQNKARQSNHSLNQSFAFWWPFTHRTVSPTSASGFPVPLYCASLWDTTYVRLCYCQTPPARVCMLNRRVGDISLMADVKGRQPRSIGERLEVRVRPLCAPRARLDRCHCAVGSVLKDYYWSSELQGSSGCWLWARESPPSSDRQSCKHVLSVWFKEVDGVSERHGRPSDEVGLLNVLWSGAAVPDNY